MSEVRLHRRTAPRFWALTLAGLVLLLLTDGRPFLVAAVVVLWGVLLLIARRSGVTVSASGLGAIPWTSIDAVVLDGARVLVVPPSGVDLGRRLTARSPIDGREALDVGTFRESPRLVREALQAHAGHRLAVADGDGDFVVVLRGYDMGEVLAAMGCYEAARSTGAATDRDAALTRLRRGFTVTLRGYDRARSTPPSPPASPSSPGPDIAALRRVVAILVTLIALAGLVRLVTPTDHDGVRRQLAFLRDALAGGAGADAQRLFPEGYFFAHALYGLAWVELGRRGVTPEQAADEAAWALERLESPDGRAPFDPGLTPAYGVFYVGWTTWLRGGLLGLRPDPALRERFLADASALAAAFDASPTPFLAAYPGQSWPCDSTVAVAALRLADSITGTARFTPTVDRWLAAARTRLDPSTGLLPHLTDASTGAPLSGARATSQSIIQRFLVEIDPTFARAQYLLFRTHFLTRPLGLGPAVREYPHGVDGPADVDSGPLVLGVSLSATVVTLGAAQSAGDTSLAAALASFGEFAGVPLTLPGGKRYAFGALPIGDAFLAWSKTALPWTTPPPDPPPPAITGWWRTPLVLILLLLALLPWSRPLLRLTRVPRDSPSGDRVTG